MQSKVPSYRLHRGSGQAIVTINRRDFYLGRHNTPDSRRRYHRLIAEYLSSPETFSLSTSRKSDAAVSELIVAFLAFVKSEVGDKEYKGIKLAMKPLRSLYGDTCAKDFGTSQYKAVRAVFVREVHPLRKKPRTRQYVNRAMVYVSRLFKWAASEQLIPAGVYEALRLIPGLKKGKTDAPESKRVRPIPISDVEKTLIYCSPIVATMVQVQLLVGCRPGEVCSLTPAMIDRTEEVWQANLDKHKTSHHEKERTLYFGPKAQNLISPFLNREPDRHLFSAREAVEQRNAQRTANRTTPANEGNRAGYSKRSRIGTESKRAPRDYYDSRTYSQAIEYACKKAKVTPWGPNRLRHTAGTKLRSEFGLETAKAMLGHSEIGVTQVYAENDRQKCIDAARAMG